MHLEIKYIELENKLEVSYKGYLVYKEIRGELETYAPFPEWEDQIEKLYEVARELNKEKKKEAKKEHLAEKQREKMHWWEKVRLKWGL